MIEAVAPTPRGKAADKSPLRKAATVRDVAQAAAVGGRDEPAVRWVTQEPWLILLVTYAPAFSMWLPNLVMK